MIRGGKDGKSSHFIKSIMSYYVTENHTENEMLARKLKLWVGVFGPFFLFYSYTFVFQILSKILEFC